MQTVTKCKCGALIVFLKTKSGKNMPVNYDSCDPLDVEYDSSKHRTHFADCPHSKQFHSAYSRLKQIKNYQKGNYGNKYA